MIEKNIVSIMDTQLRHSKQACAFSIDETQTIREIVLQAYIVRQAMVADKGYPTNLPELDAAFKRGGL